MLSLSLEDLSSKDQTDLQHHLQGCSQCRELQAEYQHIDTDIRHLQASYTLPPLLPYLLQIREQQILRERKPGARKGAISQKKRSIVHSPLVPWLSLLYHIVLGWITAIARKEIARCEIVYEEIRAKGCLTIDGEKNSFKKKRDTHQYPEERSFGEDSASFQPSHVKKEKNYPLGSFCERKNIQKADLELLDEQEIGDGATSQELIKHSKIQTTFDAYKEDNQHHITRSYHTCGPMSMDTFLCFKQYPLDRYRLIFDLNKGPYSQAYLTRDTARKGQLTVVKLFCQILFSPLQREKFLHHAQSLQYLKHPNILSLVEVKADSPSPPYIVMDYAPKGSLRKRLTHPMRMDTSLAFLLQIGSALQYAHKQQILHRNLKPENVLFNEKDEVVLCDFSTDEMSWLRSRYACMFDYLAPEQFEGPANRKSDQYSLACIAYELLAGQPPFKMTMNSCEGVQKRPDQPFPLTQINSRIPLVVERVINTALAKNAADRYPDIQTFLVTLLAGMWETLKKENELSSVLDITTTLLCAEAKAFSLYRREKEECKVKEVFWFYSGKEQQWADMFRQKLKGGGRYLWLDEWEMQSESQKCERVDYQVSHSQAIAICFGKQEFDPRSHKMLDVLLEKIAREGCFVIPVLLPGIAEKPLLPKVLEGKPSVDLRKHSPDTVERFLISIARLQGSLL